MIAQFKFGSQHQGSRGVTGVAGEPGAVGYAGLPGSRGNAGTPGARVSVLNYPPPPPHLSLCMSYYHTLSCGPLQS